VRGACGCEQGAESVVDWCHRAPFYTHEFSCITPAPTRQSLIRSHPPLFRQTKAVSVKTRGFAFSVLLETWEAATNYLADLNPPEVKTIEIAKLLGWTLKSPRA
jgi:hypothetical protein